MCLIVIFFFSRHLTASIIRSQAGIHKMAALNSNKTGFPPLTGEKKFRDH